MLKIEEIQTLNMEIQRENELTAKQDSLREYLDQLANDQIKYRIDNFSRLSKNKKLQKIITKQFHKIVDLSTNNSKQDLKKWTRSLNGIEYAIFREEVKECYGTEISLCEKEIVWLLKLDLIDKELEESLKEIDTDLSLEKLKIFYRDWVYQTEYSEADSYFTNLSYSADCNYDLEKIFIKLRGRQWQPFMEDQLDILLADQNLSLKAFYDFLFSLSVSQLNVFIDLIYDCNKFKNFLYIKSKNWDKEFDIFITENLEYEFKSLIDLNILNSWNKMEKFFYGYWVYLSEKPSLDLLIKMGKINSKLSGKFEIASINRAYKLILNLTENLDNLLESNPSKAKIEEYLNYGVEPIYGLREIEDIVVAEKFQEKMSSFLSLYDNIENLYSEVLPRHKEYLIWLQEYRYVTIPDIESIRNFSEEAISYFELFFYFRKTLIKPFVKARVINFYTRSPMARDTFADFIEDMDLCEFACFQELLKEDAVIEEIILKKENEWIEETLRKYSSEDLT